MLFSLTTTAFCAIHTQKIKGQSTHLASFRRDALRVPQRCAQVRLIFASVQLEDLKRVVQQALQLVQGH